MRIFRVVFVLVSYLSVQAWSQANSNADLRKFTLLNINKISHWFGANLWSARDPNTGGPGVEFPRGYEPPLTTVFTDGLVWGGFVRDGQTPVWRVGGSQYMIGSWAGAILSDGTYEEQDDPGVGIFRIRHDFTTANLTLEAAELNKTEDEIRSQYRADWLEWPAHKGAPFYDVDGDGIYSPALRIDKNGSEIPKLAPKAGELFMPEIHGDEPGLLGADQVVWTVANELGHGSIGFPDRIAGGPDIGLEIQLTAWAYKVPAALAHTIFKQYKLVYDGTIRTPVNARIDSMYIGQFSDVDLGTFTDDFVGVDSTRALMYCYNSSSVDEAYFAAGFAPPAVGYKFLIIPHSQLQPHQHLMTSFWYLASGGGFTEPLFGPLGTYQVAIAWFNAFRGFLPHTDPQRPQFWTNNFTGKPTKFPLSGDPAQQTGDLDGYLLSPGDRRIGGTGGPFNLSLGDTAEVTIAVVHGLGSDRLQSFALMRLFSDQVEHAFSNDFRSPNLKMPVVQAGSSDLKINLRWESDEALVSVIEDFSQSGYKFEGYNVYQLSSSQPDLSEVNAIRIATFDLINDISIILEDRFDPESGTVLQVPIQFGTNSGIAREIEITNDAFRDRPIANYQDYHFAVTAYAATTDPYLPIRAIESKPQIVTIRAEKAAALNKKEILSRVNVFPNPYLGVNRLELSLSENFVRFTHLPPGTTIRIFDLSGTHVKTLLPEQQSGQYNDWNLLDKYEKPATSGIYLAHIEMPEVGTKVLKLMIVR